ncbi:hypothetical protein DQ04_01391050 [Trypanosoma grayi]|uniref:hypothetical protein n=1 Tax=Trypanosoma grayi TaxID=71804 RepID=UPI0004F41447|nr:hypothetical protein DQ04_01391050 [Trypanosoma grayi]KEG12837.1 hypothetical protein DQ04_01391050 [Trypanosoma grayi]
MNAFSGATDKEAKGVETLLPTVDDVAAAFAQQLREAESLYYAAGLDALAGIRCVQLYSETLAGVSCLSRVRRTPAALK